MTPEMMDGIKRPRPQLRPWPKEVKARRLIDWGRVGDWAGGFGLGLLVGLVGAFILMAQLGQWGGK